MTRQTKRFFEFGTFRIDTVNRLLLREGEPIPLKAKVVETLLLLVENHGQVIEKDDLMKALWPDTFVEEANLTQNIYMLRKALGDKDYIETIPRRGYRFTAPVRQWEDPSSDLVIREQSRTSVLVEEEEETSPAPVEAREPSARSKWHLAALGLILAVAAVGTAYRLWARSETHRGPQYAINSIAVLPFKAVGAASGDEYLGLGMTDALITRLARLRNVAVRPTSAVGKYGDWSADRAGRELRVDAVLEGTVQRSDGNVRVAVQLVRVADGRTIWADHFDEPVTNIFQLQDSIAVKIAEVLPLKLSGSEQQQLARGSTRNADAYQLYLQGRYFWNKRTLPGVEKAAELFRQTIDLDPNYALAYVGLADCYLFGVPTNEPPKVLGAHARAMAKKALEIDDSLGEAHATLALLAENLEWDWPGAEVEYKRALELSPNYATAYQWYGEYLALSGRFGESIGEMKRARELDPLSVAIIKDSGIIYYAARQNDLAIAYFQKALEMDPNFVVARRSLALAYLQKREFAKAIAELQKAHEVTNGPEILSELGYAYAVAGRTQEAEKTLSDLRDMAKRRYVFPTEFAQVYTALGNKEKAFEYLEAGYREGGALAGLKSDPIWDPLRGDARFADLLKRVGF